MQSSKGGGNGKDMSKDGPQKLGNLKRSSSSSDESESSSKIINEVADEINLLNKLQYPESNGDNDSQQEQLAAVLTNNNDNSTSATANNTASRVRPGAYAINGPNFDTSDRDVGAQGSVLFVSGDSILQHSNQNTNNQQQTTDSSRLSSSDVAAASNNRTSLVDIPIPSVEATIIPDATVQNDSNKDRNKVYMATLVDDNTANNSINNTPTPLTQLKSETSLDHKELSERVVKAAQQSSSSLSRASNNRLSSSLYSLTRLKLSNMKLHGREEDMTVLRSKLIDMKKAKEVWNDENLIVDEMTTRRIIQRNSSTLLDNEQQQNKKIPELILISGISGTGKSALVMKGIKEPATKLGVTFVSGKFDLNNSSMPLSAFVTAMAQLTKIVISGDMIHNIQADINDTYNQEDSVLLIRALPGCEELFPLYNDLLSDDGESAEMASKYQYRTLSLVGKEAIARLQYAIRGLLRIMCIHMNGVVLFIDDLQWSDTATLDLLQSISLDSDIPSLLVVGAYRQDEVPETHPLALQIREKEQTGIDLTSIEIGNLTLENVTSLIAEALDMDDDAVKNLATIVHKKTSGNAFFVLMFLRSLHDEELLTYNFSIMKWTWDDDTVNAMLATENVATVLINKLKRLNTRTQNVVKVASCLGAKFSLSAVAAITDNLRTSELRRLSSTDVAPPLTKDDDEDDNTMSSLGSSLHELQGEGLWEVDSGDADICHFGHDKIQTAAFELIPLSKRDTFRGKIGNILLEKLDDDALEANLFEVVSLLNCAMNTLSDDKEERKKLAKLNHLAGMKALANTAFDSAAVYFKTGRTILGSCGWGIDQQTMLDLCSEGANACQVCRDLDTMNEMIDEVICQDIPIEDKFNVYEVKILAAHAAEDFTEALETAMDYRRQLGLPTLKNKPAHPFTVIKEFIKTKYTLCNRTAEDISKLSELTDERVVMGQRMLELAATSSFTAQPTIFPLIIFLLVNASLKYGINSSSCDAFGGYGIILCTLGKLREGTEMSKAVYLLLSKPGMGHMRLRSIFVSNCFIHHWTRPLQSTLGSLLKGYQEGLRSGDIEAAASNLLVRTYNLYYTGRSLGSLVVEIETSIDAIAQMKQDSVKLIAISFLVLSKKLIGKHSGFDLEEITKLTLQAGNQSAHAHIIVVRMEVLVFFQKWDEATSLLIEAGDLRKILVAEFLNPRFTFLEALISIKAAQDKTIPWLMRRRWKKRAMKSLKLIRSWVKKGNPNVVHYLDLLEAELAASDGKNDKAEEKYKLALAVSATNGLVQDKALSHELASAYFGRIGDNYWRDYHLGKCKECYTEWGAIAKANSIHI